MRLAAIQMRVREDRTKTLERASQLIDEAAAANADIVVMPELFSVPFVGAAPDLEYYRHAETIDGPTNTMVADKSREHGITILSSFFEKTDVPGVYHNTVCFFSGGQHVMSHRKTHLPFSNAFPEKFYFRPGATTPMVVPVNQTRVGTIICYERHFPELSRVVALGGASILCIPVACAGAASKMTFEYELRAHAIFNGLFVVCANRVGSEAGKTYYGRSAIYAPDGRSLAEGDQEQEVVVDATIDLDEVVQRRELMPYLRDRRPELYGRIVAAD